MNNKTILRLFALVLVVALLGTAFGQNDNRADRLLGPACWR